MKKGFTLLELLVVIAIIGVLASIVVASLSNVRGKARDTIRKKDIQTIYTMLSMYQDKYGGIPMTYTGTNPQGYTDEDYGGWDASAHPIGNPTFMGFIVSGDIAPKVPVDPLNNANADYTSGYTYLYYCYPPDGAHPTGTLSMQYKSETTNSWIVPYDREPDWTCL